MLHLAQISSDHTPQYEENVLEDSSSSHLQRREDRRVAEDAWKTNHRIAGGPMAGWAGAGARWATKTALYKKNVNKRGLINKTCDLSALLIVSNINFKMFFMLHEVLFSSYERLAAICLHLRPLHGVTYFIIHYNNIIYNSLGAISSVMARVTMLGIMKQMPRHGAVFGQLTGCHDQSTQHPAPKIYLHITKNIWGSNNIWKPASVLR